MKRLTASTAQQRDISWFQKNNSSLSNFSSCITSYPMDTNKCHLYSCNAATGYYTKTDKACAENEACDSTTGTCISTCKTYVGPGTYAIKPCDVVMGNQFTIRVDKISYNMFGKGGSVVFDVRYDNNGKKMEEAVGATIGDTPKWLNTLAAFSNQENRLAIHGGFIRLAPSSKPVDIKKPEATLIVEPDCTPLLNECLADLAKNGPYKDQNAGYFNMVKGWDCQFICPATPGFSQQSYAATKDIRLEMPPGYTKAAGAISQLAQNCYDRLVNLVGIESSHPIFMSYAVSTYAGCSFGADEQYKLSCFVTPKYSDATIEKLPQYAALLSAIAAGQCSGFFDQFGEVQSDALPHEFSHNFASATFKSTNNEGFATFAADAITDIGVGYMLKLECYPLGYTFSKTGNNEGGPLTTYTPWTSANHFGGACLLKEFQKLYGDKSLKSVFQIFHKLPMEKDFYLFKDVFNAAAQDDFFAKSKGIHKLSSDAVHFSGSTQYFFN